MIQYRLTTGSKPSKLQTPTGRGSNSQPARHSRGGRGKWVGGGSATDGKRGGAWGVRGVRAMRGEGGGRGLARVFI